MLILNTNKYSLFSFAAELVMMSMGGLPKEIPPLFNNTYTPIAAAGTETQVWGYFFLIL